MFTFFVTVTVFWALFHFYVAQRLVGPLLMRGFFRGVLYAVFVLLWPLSPSVFFVDSFLPEPFDLIYRWIGWTYMGAFSTLFALLVARDLVALVLRIVDARMRRKSPESGVLPTSAERRSFLMTASGGSMVGVAAGLSGLGIGRARRIPAVVRVDVPIVGLPKAFDGYQIVQLSDIHVGETIDKDFILPIVEAVTTLKPDLIAVTGDVVDGSVDKLRADISPLAYLRAKDGVLCVTGNHEYYSGVDEWCQHFEELGMSVLNNRHVMIERAGKRMLVAGVTDYSAGRTHPAHASDPKQALYGAGPHDFRILLAHQPRSAFAAAKLGYKLQLSGHTHGGQFFPWNLFVGLVQKPVALGLGKHEGMWVYVSAGTCYWGPPIRSVPAEVTSLRLRRG